MNNIDKKVYRSDGGTIGSGRIKEIAENVYGDEEKSWLARRVLELLDELETKDLRIAELETREVKLPMAYDINATGERIENKLGDHFDSDYVVAAICAAGIRINEDG